MNFADEGFYKNAYLQGRAAVITVAFAYYARLATAEIKRYTFDRVDEDNIPEEVSMCCCEIAELVFRREQTSNDSRSDGVSSESVQGWSRSYESAESRRQSFDTSVKNCVCRWLGGTGLLYRGVR